MDRYDVVVIGTGPAGEGAAMMAAKSHRRVAVVERHFEVGGGCTHWGTIPSKALRHAVKLLHDLRVNPLLREYRRALNLTYPQLLHAADGVIAKQVAQRRRYYERNKIAVLEGEARFTDPHHLEIHRTGANPLKVRGEHIVVAAGSRPYHPPELDFAHPRIRDSDSILKYPETPFAVTIYGAGVIGCEYASIFLNLGCKVTLVNTQGRLLSFLDDEISEALSYHMRQQGCIFRHNEAFDGVEARERDVVLNLKSRRKIKSDVLLWCNGRTGNSDALDLGKAGLEATARGQIKVGPSFQTTVPHIYAAGDITGPPALASVAYDQGRYAVEHALTGRADAGRATLAPMGIYTLPEISAVGRTERELQEAKVPYDVGHAAFKSLARAQMTDETVGMLKLLFHAETLEVLGVHCFGDRASEIVHIGQTVMASKDNTLKYFINTTFNYPTMAEAYRVAAHNGLNRLA
jgi:NAD(P) transhydrogenase